ncbi:dUTP diphosphatase [Desulfovibrio sp. OttesenSCG-928-M16]|nr:dUTP diphosphatase [Desulfovibrio sp. OttesenSCG-928-M16]
MTSFSPPSLPVAVLFFRDAAALYGEDGLFPATPNAAGIDLRACLHEGAAITIPPGERRCVPSGLAIEPRLPGVAAFIYSRSGLGAVKGLTVAQGVGLIDPDYRGEILIYLLNTGLESQVVRHKDRVAQLLFQPFVRPAFSVVESLGATERGAGGFGHTGQ